MPEIFHSINSGLYFRLGAKAILFDGLHKGRSLGLSDTPEELLFQMESGSGYFSGDTLLCFTHSHPDHFDSQLAERFMHLYPGAEILSPEKRSFEPKFLGEGLFYTEHGDFRLWAMETGHQGGSEMQCRHWLYLLAAGERCFLICGDARLDEAGLHRIKAVAPGCIEKAFINVYHLYSAKEQRLMRLLSPQCCCIIHLPKPEDDKNLYREAAAEALSTLKEPYRIETARHMSWL